MNSLSFLIDVPKVDIVKTVLAVKGSTNYTVFVSEKYARVTVHEISIRQAADLASTLERTGVEIDVL